MENIIKINSSKYGDCIKLEEYNGKMNLVAAREDKDGKVWSQWCHPQGLGKGAPPKEKAVPMKVTLGDKDEAVAVLTELLGMLGVEDIDVPF
jgi:hypothetical protein